jgi:uncharacterized protein YfaS (alpha-2-macroglobulin family)
VRVVKREGGALYWGASATYFDPSQADARQGSRHLAISRRYSKLTPVTVPNRNAIPGEPASRIVYREQEFSGTAAPGDLLAVRLVVAGSDDWQYLALEDPLPAGVEAIRDSWSYPLERPGSWRWWSGTAEYRDSQTTFFLQSLASGRAEFVYLVKVISAGAFRAIPAQVYPMYSAGVYAVSEPQQFTIPVSSEASR